MLPFLCAQQNTVHDRQKRNPLKTYGGALCPSTPPLPLPPVIKQETKKYSELHRQTEQRARSTEYTQRLPPANGLLDVRELLWERRSGPCFWADPFSTTQGDDRRGHVPYQTRNDKETRKQHLVQHRGPLMKKDENVQRTLPSTSNKVSRYRKKPRAERLPTSQVPVACQEGSAFEMP